MKQYLIIIFSFLLLLGYIFFIVISYRNKRLTKLQFSISCIILFLFVISFVPESQIRYLDDEKLVFGIDRITLYNISFNLRLILLIASTIYPIYHVYLKRKISKSGIRHANDFFQQLYADERFHTAFSTSLPKGDKDAELGIDYIPFMLQNIETRRKRFKEDAENFLTATIGMGLLFIIVVFYFGYILLNDASVGLPKTVKDLKNNLEKADYEYKKWENFNSQNHYKELKNKYNLDLDAVKSINYADSTAKKDAINEFNNIISTFWIDNNLDKFSISIDTLRSVFASIKTENSQDDNFENRIAKVWGKLNHYVNSIDANKRKMIISTRNALTLIPELEREIKKPTFLTNELIKRITLSIVITSFFLVILRYLAKLYKENHQLMVAAENEDLALRKFYVGLKNTDKNNEERKLVIQSFLANIEDKDGKTQGKAGISKEDTTLLKEMLNALMKKL